MYPDPGWRAAAKYGFLAIVARSRSMKVRPAITAARAGVLANAYTALVIGGVLTFLGESEEPDYMFAGLMVLAGSVVSVLSVLFLRYKQPWRLSDGSSPVQSFVALTGLISAFASVPMLMGFVTFFLGGGYLMYAVGVLVSLVLLFGPGRPSEAMAHRVAEKLGPPTTPTQLWSDLLDPTK